jgi:hypothetical protein
MHAIRGIRHSGVVCSSITLPESHNVFGFQICFSTAVYLFIPEFFASYVCISYIEALGIIAPEGLEGSPEPCGWEPSLDASWLHASQPGGTPLALL